jgi:hypothetical protein
MSLVAIALLNGLLGASCGLWFRVKILVPLIAIAFVEVAILKQTGIWSSVILSAIALISSIEIGYLIGSALATLWQSSRRGKVLRDLMTFENGRLLH